MTGREPDRGSFSDRGRTAGRAPGGPAPPERRKKTGYYQRFAKEDAPATQPEALSSSSRLDVPDTGRAESEIPRHEQSHTGRREAQPFDQVKRPPDASPSEWRQEATERPTLTDGPEEPGRLRFTPSDELNKGAGKLPQGERPTGKQRGSRQQQAGRNAADGRPPEGGKTSRLHFTKEERPPEPGTPEPTGSKSGTTGEAKGNAYQRQRRKTDRAGAKAGRYDAKLEKARGRLPTKRRVRLKQEADPATGKLRHRLRFEQEVKPAPSSPGHLSNLAADAAEAALFMGTEDGRDNIGVDATQTTGQSVEHLARQTSRFVERHRAAPYAKVRKLEKQAAKANVNYLYRQAIQDNPEGMKSLLARMQQKRHIKKQYAKAAREAQRTAKQTGTSAKETAGLVGNMAHALTSFVGAHKKGVILAVLIALVVFFFGSCTSSCSSMLVGGFSSILGTSYGSEDTDIIGANADYAELENQLQRRIDNIEIEYPGYDEYRYELDEIIHGPYELTSYLTAKLQEYTRDGARAELQALFNEQYTLTVTETVEVRYRTETHTSTDPETGETTEETEEVPYNYYILTVTLKNKTLQAVTAPRLNDEQKEIYMATLMTHGNKPYLWDDVYAGGGTADPGEHYEIPGEALSDPDFAALIAEAEKYLGYPYVWGGSSPSTSFDCSGFVCWVYTHSGVYNLPRTTASGIYSQCAHVSPSEARPGDCIFFTGTYASAGPVSHIGIYVGNGMMIHCGDPIKYANINTPYWQQHFYAFGRLPY